MTAGLDPKRVEDFACRLSAHARRRIDLAAVWRAFAQAFPARPQGAEERAWLAAAIRSLEDRGLVRLPSAAGPRWDRTIGIPLPAWVELPSTPPVSHREFRSFPWHPRLAWVADMQSLPEAHERFLKRVHEGLVAGRFACAAPSKYRSLQLTGDEKRLTQLSRTALFGPGRLDFAMLGCLPDAPPLVLQRISDKRVALVFENAGPFAVACRVLRSMPDQPYGTVVCGEGARFQQSLVHLGSLPPAPERIEYVGDFDWAGVRIASEAARAASKAGLPEIVPAVRLHRAMLESAASFGFPTGWPGIRKRPVSAQALKWLSDDVKATVRDILESGRRIPEEVLGPEELAQVWRAR